MDKFIKLLLETEKTVIIPGLGAIVLDDPETGKLIFNEYLKFNDGKLDAVIVKESNMDLQEAQNYIAKYVREIQNEIDKGESYDIFGLGSIKKDEEGTVHFKGNLNTKGTSNSAPKEAVNGPSPSPNFEEKESKKPEASPTPPIEANTPISKESKTEGNEKPAAKTEKKEAPSKEKPTATPVTDSKSTKPKKDVKPAKKKEEKKKKKFGILFWIVLVLLLIAGAGGTYIGMNYNKVKEYMGWDQFEGASELAEDMEDNSNTEENEPAAATPEENNSEEAEDSLVASEPVAEEMEASDEAEPVNEELLVSDEVEVKETVKVQPEPEELATPASSGEYHLIAGTFSDKSNADGLVSDLKGLGHPAQIIGYLNGMHYVSVKSFNSASEARQGMSSVQNDVPKAWVYKKP